MSERYIGKIFVELDLDPSRYMRSQQRLLRDATTTTLSIEDNFKKLNIKTSAEYNLMRAKITNAYEGIKHSGQATANDLVRAEREKNKQLKNLNDEQYGTSMLSLSNLRKHWLATTAAIAAATALAMKAWNAAKQAAEFEQSKQAFVSMATKMGKVAEEEFTKVRNLSAGLIDDKSMVQAMNRALSLGIPIEKLGDLMLIARAKARDMGITTTQAFNDIATGIGRASPLILDNLGLSIKVGVANENLAKSLGKTVSQLTEEEKKLAVLNATLDAGKEALTRHNLETLTDAEAMQKLEVQFKNIELQVGRFTKALIVNTFALFDNKTWANEAYVEQRAAEARNRTLTHSIREITLAKKESTAKLQQEVEALKKSKTERDKTTAAVGKHDKALKSVTKTIKEEIKTLDYNTYLRDQRWAVIDLHNAEDMLIDKEMERINVIRRGEPIVREVITKEQDSFSDLFRGIKQGYDASVENAYTWAQGGRDIFNSFANDTTQALSSNLFDVMKGDFSNLGEAWKTMLDSMLNAFADILAKMLVQWAMSGLANLSISMGLPGIGGAITGGATAATTSAAGGAATGAAVTGAAATGVTATGAAATAGASGGAATTSGITGAGSIGMAALPVAAVAAAWGIDKLGEGGRSKRWAVHGIDYDPVTGGLKLGDTDLYRPLVDASRDFANLSASLDAPTLTALLTEIDAWASSWPTKTKGQGADAAVLDDVISSVLSSYTSGSIASSLESAGDAYWSRIAANANAEFGLSKGMNYVPSDNYPALLHQGEAVLTRKQADSWRSGGGIHFHFPNALIVDKASVQELAELIYPYTRKLEAWGH